MIINPILKEKYDSQKRLNEMANNDLRTYYQNSHSNVIEMAKKYGLELKFTEKKGGYLKSIKEELVENIL
jgi:hypothetical protein